MAMLELRLLGSFEVCLDGTPVAIPSRPAQSLLACLALSAGTAHRREKLAGMLWPEADKANARSNLRHALWRIRKAIETDQVAHEALIREWPRLREWLNQDRRALRVWRQLLRAAQEWEHLGRDAGGLYRGARL